jgi:RNA polymerase sigma factor (sigma-70 family)
MATGQLSPILRYIRTISGAVGAGDLEDAELLSRFARHGDEAAFAAVVRRHGPMVLGVCRRVVRDWHTAEDAFQATFLVLARKAGALLRPELLGQWLYGVAYRTAGRARVEAARRRSHESRAANIEARPAGDTVDWDDLRPLLDEEVNRLPERYRRPVVLCYLQGQTNAEAATRLGCSRGTVATLLARARARLSRRLRQRGVTLSAAAALAVLGRQARGGGVSAALERGTVKAAVLLAAGKVEEAGAVAGRAVALAEGAARIMLRSKIRITAGILAAVTFLGAGAGVATYRARAEGPADIPPTLEATPPPVARSEAPPPPPPVEAAEENQDRKATFRTANFEVTAPSREIARQVGTAAEHNRKALALLWLGKERPAWRTPCPVRVTITTDGRTSSCSTFCFEEEPQLRGMILEGPLDRIFADLLPHEMTHTILADSQRRPLPRWADEGAAMLSESAAGRAAHEEAMERLLRKGRLLPLLPLLDRQDYPKDVGAFYAQSYALADFLVEQGGRKKFLAFVARGQKGGWDQALLDSYDYKGVKDLERAWLAQLRKRLGEKPAAEEPRLAPARVVFKGQLPATPAPEQALVVLGKNGTLLVQRRITYAQPVTSYRRATNGERSYYYPVTTYKASSCEVTRTCDLAEVRAYDTQGEAVDAKDLRKMLQKETVGLIAQDRTQVDPLHLRLYKKGTLIFVLPRSGPEPVPTAPTPPAVPTAPEVPSLAPVAPEVEPVEMRPPR